MRNIGLPIMAVVLISWGAVSAMAQMVCSERSKVVGSLESKYQETPVAIGVTPTGGMVELLTTKDGLTWTILVSLPIAGSGGKVRSCLIASGEGWRNLPPITLGPDT